ncbi:TonB-dependent receptor [Crenobacter cavernae]|uniref:TonB-dependent siderophore receptor n=1 Tax=Crenobacter cavernae TaxID=2290923 RepID=A0A345Y568_9NEIS|nr:TonB-dependent siderophore receptor [Crenobacter cavernae]AXK39070.1 TonB-dependent siderophore receptor [Crenobacter cavernae]
MKSKLTDSPSIEHGKLPARRAVGLIAAAAFVPALAHAADKSSAELETVKVTAEEPVRGTYKTETSSIGKLNQKLKDIPQSVSVVNKQLIKDQGASTLKDALRNVPGITFAAGEGGRTGDQVVIRGFAATTDTYLDGIRDSGQYNRDPFNDERVEVLKGASSMLFGRGSTGGVVNQVSKTPFAGEKIEGNLTVGTNDFQRVTFDVNQAFSDTAAARLNLMATNDGSDRGPVENTRWGIAPSVAFGLGEPLTLTLSAFHMEENNVPDYGVPYDPNTKRPIDVDRKKFYGFNSDFEDTVTDMATAKLSYKFSDDTSITNQLRYSRFERDVSPTAARLVGATAGVPVTDATTLRRSKPMRDGVDDAWVNQTDFVTKFDTGTLRHTVLAGMELIKEESSTNRYALRNNPANSTVGAASPSDPVDLSRYKSANTTYDVTNVGLYAMDTLELTPQWKAVLGARWDRFDGDYQQKNFNSSGAQTTTSDINRKDKAWSYRTGLIYQPDTVQSYYASYGSLMNPSGATYALDKPGENVKPEKNQNYELGTKWDLMDGDASLRAALFRTVKFYERNTDPLVPSLSVLSNKRHTNGVEIEGAGRLTERWELFAGATYMDSKIDEESKEQPGSKGKMPRYTPRATANLWTTYKLTDVVTGGFGLTYIGKRYAGEAGSTANTNHLPAYTTANAMLAYETRKYLVQLNLNNLANKRYYDGAYGGHATFGTPREAQLTVGFKY